MLNLTIRYHKYHKKVVKPIYYGQNKKTYLKQMIQKLPQRERFFHNLLKQKQMTKQQSMKFNLWVQGYSNTKNGQIYNNYSLTALVVSAHHSEIKYITQWTYWSYNLFCIKYINGIAQGLKNKIYPSSYAQLLKKIYPSQKLDRTAQISKIQSYVQPQLNDFMIASISEYFIKHINSQSIKNRSSRTKLRYAIFLLNNLQKLKSFEALLAVIKNIKSIFDLFSISDKIRYIRVMEQIQNSILRLKDDKLFVRKMSQYKLKQDLIRSCYFLYQKFQYKPNPQLHSYLCSQFLRYIDCFHQNYFIYGFFSIFTYLPNYIYQNQNNQIVNWKSRVEKAFIEKIENDKRMRDIYYDHDPRFIQIYALLAAKAAFYQAGLTKVEAEINDGFYTIKGQVSYPKIHRIYIESYYKALMKGFKPKNSWLLTLLQKHYYKDLNQCDLEKLESISVQERQIYDSFLDNQAVMFLSQAIQKLGIPYQREVKISNKMADFLMDGKIIIESDGDSHFNYQSLQFGDNFIIRNLSHILNGYKVISINTMQLNKLRGDMNGLIGLLKQKIQIINQPNIHLVS